MAFLGIGRKYRKGEYVKCTDNLVANQWTAFLTCGKVVEDDGERIRVRVLKRSRDPHDINCIWWMQRQFLCPVHDDCCCDVDTSLFE